MKRNTTPSPPQGGEKRTYSISLLILLICLLSCNNQEKDLSYIFQNPPESTKPWVFWYWVKGAVSKEGIIADLEAMKSVGIGGAYIFTIQGADTTLPFNNPVEQLTPEWWSMIKFAFSEAKRVGLKLAMHSCDGFTTAGGPWITPEMSMQKVVWSKIETEGSRIFNDTLPAPETIEGFYKDIALFAYPTSSGSEYNTDKIKPKVTTNTKGLDLQYLSDPENNEVFKSTDSCWIQYFFEKPFTCQTIHIKTKGLNYQSHQLIIESSDDGNNFKRITRLKYPRHGWQDYESDLTHSIPATTAKYFRFIYDKNGSEPGSEDLDAARWNPALKIQGISLSGEAAVHQFEGKNGSIWRIAKSSSNEQLPDSVCILLNKIINISQYFNASTGILNWQVPEGKWTILRIGHTSTGHTNYIGGKGKGLECDKFNPEIIKFQFDQWFGKAFEETDAELADDVLKVFHIDSWECGSQNWSTIFPEEFKKRRGYDIIPYLPVMTGLPVENKDVSENFLYDVRKTISELIVENFFVTMAENAKEKGCIFSAESVAPVMVSDGMQHFSTVDIPMGEFWHNSPTHDKPTDILDAVSGAHIYGKPIIQAESFTTLRMDWTESPASLKTLGDRNFALGINRIVFHVYIHNPWKDKKPGMTLSGVGLYFQRDQTWWKQGKAWIEYLSRCQAMLQQGNPVVDIAVFTGEELPRRSFTPDRLTGVLPGLFDNNYLENEKTRWENAGTPMHNRPDGVNNSVNTYDPVTTPDPLRGYKYDSFNKDVLLRLTKVKDGKIVLPGGASYSVLVIPGSHKMNPNNRMSSEVADKIIQLIYEGATVIFEGIPECISGIKYENIDSLKSVLSNGYNLTETPEGVLEIKKIGKGNLIKAPITTTSLYPLSISRDLYFMEGGEYARGIAWNHRSSENFHIYFISNQIEKTREIEVSARVYGYVPEIFDPITGGIKKADIWAKKDGRTKISVRLEPNSSLFLVFREKTKEIKSEVGNIKSELNTLMQINENWNLTFDAASGGPQFPVKMQNLSDWTKIENDSIKYYSGTVTYSNTFDFSFVNKNEVFIDLGYVADIAEVFVNEKSCGIAWTYPYKVNISEAILNGKNDLRIEVTNTWRNRLIGDHNLPSEKQITWTTAPFRLEGKPLTPAGLMGPVRIVSLK